MGSYIELMYFMGGRTVAYKRLRDNLRGKDWEFVGFGEKHMVLRVERDNIEYDRRKGTIKSRFFLGTKR